MSESTVSKTRRTVTVWKAVHISGVDASLDFRFYGWTDKMIWTDKIAVDGQDMCNFPLRFALNSFGQYAIMGDRLLFVYRHIT